MKKITQINEGQGSINVTEVPDLSRIMVLAGFANSSTARGTEYTVETVVEDELDTNRICELAGVQVPAHQNDNETV